MPHEKLMFDDFTCEYNLTDGQNKAVKLNWQSHPQNDAFYILKITKPGGTAGKPYSLYSLCVQGRRHAVEIEVTKGTALFWEDEDATLPAQKNGNRWVIPKTGGYERNVHFITFTTGSCELTIESLRVIKHRMKRNAVLVNHDTLPDPPVTGGE